eukprot:m.8752 g.8752  ORF g.8752 m.8752 type:complete len:679 (+) comp3326_c0_seq2:63-2099(+)
MPPQAMTSFVCSQPCRSETNMAYSGGQGQQPMAYYDPNAEVSVEQRSGHLNHQAEGTPPLKYQFQRVTTTTYQPIGAAQQPRDMAMGMVANPAYNPNGARSASGCQAPQGVVSCCSPPMERVSGRWQHRHEPSTIVPVTVRRPAARAIAPNPAPNPVEPPAPIYPPITAAVRGLPAPVRNHAIKRKPDIPGLQGNILVDDPTIIEMADDFGHAIHELPRFVVQPKSAEDVKLTVEYAISHNLRVCARGVGHSTWGQAQVHEGIALDMRNLKYTRISPDNSTITVGMGNTWEDVVKAGLRNDPPVRVPVTTSNLFLSVGGSLSMCAMDYTTSSKGGAIEHMLNCLVVTGLGEIKRCSPTENVELFNAVRGGLGEYGVMIEADFPLTTDIPTVKSYFFAFDDLDKALEAEERLHRNPHVQGVIMEPLPKNFAGIGIGYQVRLRIRKCPLLFVKPGVEWVHLLVAERFVFEDKGDKLNDDAIDRSINRNIQYMCNGRWVDVQPYFQWKQRIQPLIQLDIDVGTWFSPHVQSAWFVPWTKRTPVCHAVLDYMERSDRQHSLVAASIGPYRRSSFSDNTSFMLPADGQDFFLIAILRVVNHDADKEDLSDFGRIGELTAEARHIHQILLNAGVEDPKAYPWTTVTWDWEAHYGHHWPRQLAWKQQFDPKNILGGCNIFQSYVP